MRQIISIFFQKSFRVKQKLPILLVIFALTFYTGLVSLVSSHCARMAAEKNTAKQYEEKMTAMQAKLDEERKKAESLNNAAEKNEYIMKAELLAKVLYGFRNNSKYDIITACWCVFNRVDIKTGEYSHLTTLEEVIDQPEQWMGYSVDNPVIENLYRTAYEQLEIWLKGGHRPVSCEYVFLVWSPNKIYLKTSLEDIKDNKTWHYTG